MPLHPFYIRKEAALFEQQGTSKLTPLFIYQPTPEGVTALCQHYSKKYSIDLICIDFSERIGLFNDSMLYFKHLCEHPHLLAVPEEHMKGFILSYRQNHALPILVYTKAGEQHMIIFDSNSGASIKGYYNVANFFPDFHVYLNDGSRQSDGLSCITDAICILKEALQIENLVPLIRSKVIEEHPAFRKTRFFETEKPEYFNVFSMPEPLLLTAQVSDYVTKAGANLEVIVRGGQSLGFYREQFRMEVILLKNGEPDFKEINGYLFTKSLEHRTILDCILEQEGLLDDASELPAAPPVNDGRAEEDRHRSVERDHREGHQAASRSECPGSREHQGQGNLP